MSTLLIVFVVVVFLLFPVVGGIAMIVCGSKMLKSKDLRLGSSLIVHPPLSQIAGGLIIATGIGWCFFPVLGFVVIVYPTL